MIGRPEKSSHVLLTLGVLFTMGGVVRFLPTGSAAAEDASQLAASDQQEPDGEPTRAETPSAKPFDSEDVCFTGEAAERLAEDRWLFDSEQEALRDREIAVEARELEVQAHIEELRALQTTLDVRWKEMQAESYADLQHLAGMYAAMKPAQAASIFDKMDPSFAAGFFRLMDSEQAGLILAAMDARTAYAVSVELASANADLRQAEDGM